jgi:hypothetical protein
LYRHDRQCHEAFVQIMGEEHRGHVGSSVLCPGIVQAATATVDFGVTGITPP